MAGLKLISALVVISLAIGGGWVGAQVHHVVGGERGWHPSADLGSWASERIFRVGDHIWFGYAAAQESIVEVSNMAEYLSCDVTNPIRMFTDGMNKIPLEEEGVRYFASGNLESCKNGLKLHVEVKPQAVATGPTPSASAQLNGLGFMLFIGLLLFSMGF